MHPRIHCSSLEGERWADRMDSEFVRTGKRMMRKMIDDGRDGRITDDGGQHEDQTAKGFI